MWCDLRQKFKKDDNPKDNVRKENRKRHQYNLQNTEGNKLNDILLKIYLKNYNYSSFKKKNLYLGNGIALCSEKI